MTEPIDDLVTTHLLKKAELRELGQKIASSATPMVVAFVDLAESTQIKQGRAPEDWLGYVFEFIQRVDQFARGAKGTVVKRIGDELMVTFKDVLASEGFVDSLIADAVLQEYRYRVAADFGNVYLFRFVEHLENDPYGPVVDRCARIAKLAGAGTVICTRDYRNQIGQPTGYSSMGPLALRGIREPEELFARSLVRVDSEGYLKPIVNAVNQEGPRVEGYRFVGRRLTTEYVREFGNGTVRPFLARELINIPKLPYTPKEFAEVTGATSDLDEKAREFVGYFVEWEGTLVSFTRDEYQIILTLQVGDPFDPYSLLALFLPLNNLDLVKVLKKGQRLRARGVIQDARLRVIFLNYVDIEVVDAK